jgi:hypothetical protein
LSASNESEIDAAFATAMQLRDGAMLVGADPFLNSQRDKSSLWRRGTLFPRSTSSANTRSQVA